MVERDVRAEIREVHDRRAEYRQDDRRVNDRREEDFRSDERCRDGRRYEDERPRNGRRSQDEKPRQDRRQELSPERWRKGSRWMQIYAGDGIGDANIEKVKDDPRMNQPVTVGGKGNNTESWDPSSTFVRPEMRSDEPSHSSAPRKLGGLRVSYAMHSPFSALTVLGMGSICTEW
jgi:hypothetical protein